MAGAQPYQRECLHCRSCSWETLATVGINGSVPSRMPQGSKAQSQRLWLSQPKNRDHFRGSENVPARARLAKGASGLLEKTQKPTSALQDFVRFFAVSSGIRIGQPELAGHKVEHGG